jgi:cell division control protein 6
MLHRSVFKDKAILDIHFIPDILVHRDKELRLLNAFFDHMITAPFEMSQRAIIIGGVGCGKTVLAQYFGRMLREKTAKRHVNSKYIHVNCREVRGSLFMVLSRVVKSLRPEFPERGYAAIELLNILKQILDEDDTQILLCLDEVDTLIEVDGSDAMYYLTRFQETNPEESRRFNLLCISKSHEVFKKLDQSTLSSLQRNIIWMSEYSSVELADIIQYRVDRAFRNNAIPLEIVDFIAELAAKEHGDARYAINLLWGAGNYADQTSSNQVLPEHVRKTAVSLFPVLNKEAIRQLSLHEQLTLLGIARYFISNKTTYASTGEIEQFYQIVCEEHNEKPRAHTQFWKYLKNLKTLDAVNIKLQTSSQGRTQLISLEKIPAEDLAQEVQKIIEG